MSIQIICKALFESFLLFLYLDQTWSLTNPSKTKSLLSCERVVKRQRLKMIAHCQINPNIKIRLLIHVNVVDSIKQHAIIYSLCGSVCNKMFPIFSPWILGQIGLPMEVLESAHREDSKTPPTCLIWSFGWDIQGRRQGSISKQKVVKEQSFFEMLSIVFSLK